MALKKGDALLSVDARQSTQYLRLHATVQTSAPLETVQVPSHPGLAFSRRGMNAAEAWINSTDEAGGRDLTIQFRSLGPAMGQQVVTRTVDDATVQERYVRFSVDVRDPAFAGSLRPLPRSFLFLVDASGSMGISNRWSLASDTVLRLGQSLGPGESYASAAFHGKKVITQSDVPHQWTHDSEGEVARFLETIHPAGSASRPRPRERQDRVHGGRGNRVRVPEPAGCHPRRRGRRRREDVGRGDRPAIARCLRERTGGRRTFPDS